MQFGIDISVLGVPQLEKQLHRLPLDLQKKAVKKAFRKSAKRIRADIVEATPVEAKGQMGRDIHGRFTKAAGTKRPPGTLKRAMRKAPIRALKGRGRKTLGIGIGLPFRKDLDIAPDDPHYWPAAVEYGQPKRGIPGRAFIRHTVDRVAEREFAAIAEDLADILINATKR